MKKIQINKIQTQVGIFVIKYRWLSITLSLFCVVSVGSGIRFLHFSNDSRVFFSEENPQLKALNALERTYTKFENVFFTVAPKSGNIFTRDTLIALEELTQEAWKIPYSSRVDSIINHQYTKVEEDDLLVENLVHDAENLTTEQIEEIRRIALNDPLLVNRIISPSGHVAGVNVNIVKPEVSGDAPDRIAEASYTLKARILKKYPDLDIYVTGVVMIDSAFKKAAKDDMMFLVPAMCFVLLLTLAFCLRSVTGTVVTFIVILFSMFIGMGLAGWLNITITAPSANAPIIILTLAVADSVHILTTMLHQMRLGLDQHQAIKESVRINLQPVLVTSLTTAVGFLTMNFSDAPPFRDLGNIVAMGIGAALLYSLFFLPALMAVLPLKANSRISTDSALTPRIEQFSEFIIAQKKIIIWVATIIIIALSTGITHIELNDDFVKYFSTRFDFRRATDFTADNLTGMYTIDWDLDSGQEGGVNDPQYQRKVEQFANWFRRQKHVCHVYTFTDIIKQINRNMHNNNEAFYTLPGNRELAAQYMLLYEMNLPFGLDLNDRINVQKSSSRMTVSLVGASTKEMREIELAGREWLNANASPSMYTHGSGVTMMFSYLSERNIKSMLFASILALVLISMIMIFVLRSFKLGFISLLPNLAPALMGFGVWGYTVGQVGLAVSVMIAMTMGIVVDDTIHFLAKYQRGRTEYKMSTENAVRFAFKTVGSPMWITTVTLIGGFTVLAFSGFQINSHMGGMTVITITLALLLDFFLLPALLLKLDRTKQPL